MTDVSKDMDCEQALEHLYDYLDGELTAERTAEVHTHLERCRHCFEISSFESAFLRFLEARARARSAPPDLKKRILERILAEGDSPAAR